MVAPPSLLHDEDEGEDEDPFLSDDEKKEMDLIVQDFDGEHTQNFEIALLAVPLPPPPQQQQSVDFPRCRMELNQLFSIRTDRVLAEANGVPYWNMRGKETTLPRWGKDTHLDAKLTELGLKNNRTYVSSLWLKYRKNQGVYPPPVFEVDNVDDTRALINSLLVFAAVIEKAMALTKKHFTETCDDALDDLNGAIDYAKFQF
jgi:hypothetical protein